MIRNLIRTAAALPLGAFALTALPVDIAAASAPTDVEISISHACFENFGGDFVWVVDIDNDTLAAAKITVIADAVKWSEMTVTAGGGGQMTAGASEGLSSSVTVLVDGQEYDSASVELVDCHADGAVSASISLACPGKDAEPGEDIAVVYSIDVDGTAVEFAWRGPDGTEDTLVVSDKVANFASKTFEGDVVDVWVRRTDTDQVLATLQTTVDCTPEPASDDSAETDDTTTDQASEANLPETGGSATLAWWALGTTVIGAAALAFAQRRPAAGK